MQAKYHVIGITLRDLNIGCHYVPGTRCDKYCYVQESSKGIGNKQANVDGRAETKRSLDQNVMSNS